MNEPWFTLSWVSAAYVWFGFVPIYLAGSRGYTLLLVLAILVWLLNWFVLRYANKRW